MEVESYKIESKILSSLNEDIESKYSKYISNKRKYVGGDFLSFTNSNNEDIKVNAGELIRNIIISTLQDIKDIERDKTIELLHLQESYKNTNRTMYKQSMEEITRDKRIPIKQISLECFNIVKKVLKDSFKEKRLEIDTKIKSLKQTKIDLEQDLKHTEQVSQDIQEEQRHRKELINNSEAIAREILNHVKIYPDIKKSYNKTEHENYCYLDLTLLTNNNL